METSILSTKKNLTAWKNLSGVSGKWYNFWNCMNQNLYFTDYV